MIVVFCKRFWRIRLRRVSKFVVWKLVLFVFLQFKVSQISLQNTNTSKFPSKTTWCAFRMDILIIRLNKAKEKQERNYEVWNSRFTKSSYEIELRRYNDVTILVTNSKSLIEFFFRLLIRLRKTLNLTLSC